MVMYRLRECEVIQTGDRFEASDPIREHAFAVSAYELAGLFMEWSCERGSATSTFLIDAIDDGQERPLSPVERGAFEAALEQTGGTVRKRPRQVAGE